MARDVSISKGVILSGICLPLAFLIGYLLARPDDPASFAFLGIVASILAFPVFLQFHHQLFIVCWNAAMVFFFVPGQPKLGFILAFWSLFLSVITAAIRRQQTYLNYRPVSYPLYAIAIVTITTMYMRGGIGGRAFGSETWGAMRYLGVIAAIVGYFAFVARPVESSQVKLFASLFFLSGITAIVSDIAYAAGPSWYFLYALFPANVAALQAMSGEDLRRFAGFTVLSQACLWYMMMRYGIRGIINWYRPWRLILFVGFFIVGLFGGYRSGVILFVMVFFFQFCLEGLFKSLLFPTLAVTAVGAGLFLSLCATNLPMSVQRSLSFLPIEVHPLARQDAIGTTDWRLTIWKIVIPDIPQYLLLGKGYSFDASDLLLTQLAVQRGQLALYEETLVSGNYHSGILTLIIPFGIFGVLAFAAFCWGSLRALWFNYRYGDPALLNINRFLFVYFLGRLFYFLTVYGQFDLDLMLFTGTVGLSIAINRGVRQKENPKPELSAQTE